MSSLSVLRPNSLQQKQQQSPKQRRTSPQQPDNYNEIFTQQPLQSSATTTTQPQPPAVTTAATTTAATTTAATTTPSLLQLNDDNNKVVVVSPATNIVRVNVAKFWGWATFSFFVPFIIVAAIIGGVNPSLAQKTDNLGQPNGEIDLAKLFGAAIISGLIVLVIYVIVVLGRPDKFAAK